MVIIVFVTILWLSLPTTCCVDPAPGTRYIGVACAKTNLTAYKCTITSADTDVDFSRVNTQIITSEGEVIGVWHSGVDFGNANEIDVVGALPPLSATSRLADQGDSLFGLGDYFLLDPVDGPSLNGLIIKLAGGGASGIANFA